MRKRIWIGLILLTLLAAAGGGGYWAYTRYFARAKAPQAPVMQTGTVRRGDIVITADGTGNLLPSTEKTVAFLTTGTVTEVKVQIGDKVQAGDVLARMNTVDLDAAIREATYTLEQARLALQKTQRKAEEGTDLAIAAEPGKRPARHRQRSRELFLHAIDRHYGTAATGQVLERFLAERTGRCLAGFAKEPKQRQGQDTL